MKRRNLRQMEKAIISMRHAAENYQYFVKACIMDRIGTDDRFTAEDFTYDLIDLAYWLTEYRKACGRLAESLKS